MLFWVAAAIERPWPSTTGAPVYDPETMVTNLLLRSDNTTNAVWMERGPRSYSQLVSVGASRRLRVSARVRPLLCGDVSVGISFGRLCAATMLANGFGDTVVACYVDSMSVGAELFRVESRAAFEVVHAEVLAF